MKCCRSVYLNPNDITWILIISLGNLSFNPAGLIIRHGLPVIAYNCALKTLLWAPKDPGYFLCGSLPFSRDRGKIHTGVYRSWVSHVLQKSKIASTFRQTRSCYLFNTSLTVELGEAAAFYVVQSPVALRFPFQYIFVRWSRVENRISFMSHLITKLRRKWILI